MADNVIGIQFGVAGGSSIGGESGRRIKAELEALSEQIQLQVNIDQNHFAKQLTTLKAELERKLGELKITINTKEVTATQGKGGTSSGGTGSTNAQTTAYSGLQKQLEALAATESRLAKLEKEKGVSYEITKQKVQDLRQAYIANRLEGMASGDITQEQSQKLNEYASELERAIQLEKERDNSTKTESEAKEVARLEMSYAKLQRNAASLYTDGGFDKVISRSKEAREAVDAFNQKVQNLAEMDADGNIIRFKGTAEDVKALNKEFIETQSKLKGIQKETDTLGNKLKDTFTSKLIQTIAYAAISAVERLLKKVYQNVIELDAAITDLQIASGKTRKEIEALTKGYSRLAQQLGATTVEVMRAADTWLRQGYTAEETNRLITNSTMLAKLGQMDAAEASTALTSAMKGYGVAVEESISIVDKFTKVDMEAAASAGDIATAMAETATSAKLAGVSMDTLIGYIATVKEVTQDGAESVGTFYKTLFARMNNVAAGNFVDEETGESLNDVETVLNKLNIALRDTNGEFRSSSDVLSEVSSRWRSFDSVQQHAIATAMAGTRQQEKFIVLMENYGTAIGYANSATDSSGTAMEKYGAYTDSLEGRINSLTASFEEFSSTILDSDLVAFFVDVLNGAVNALNAITSFGDGIVTILLIVSAATIASFTLIGIAAKKLKGHLDLLKTSFINALKNPLTYMSILTSLFIAFQDKMNGTTKFLVGLLAIAATAFSVFCVLVKTGAISTASTVSAAIMNIPIFGWIVAIIQAVIIAFTALIGAFDAWIETDAEARESALETAKAMQEEANSLKEVAEASEQAAANIRTLVNELKDLEETDSDASNWMEKVQEIGDEVANLYPDEQLTSLQAINRLLDTELNYNDLINMTLEERLGLLDDIEKGTYAVNTKTAQQAYTAQKNATEQLAYALRYGYEVTDGDEKWGSLKGNQIKSAIKEAEEIANMVDGVTMKGNAGKDIDIRVNSANLTEYVEKLRTVVDEYEERYEYNFGALKSNAIYQYLATSLSEAEESLSAQKSALKSVVESSAMMHGVSLDVEFDDTETKENIRATYDSAVSTLIDNIKNDATVSAAIADGLIDEGVLSEYAQEYIRKYHTELYNAANTMPVIVPLKSAIDIFDEIEGEFELLKTAIDDFNESGSVSADTIRSITDEFPELLKYINQTENGFEMLGQSMDEILADYWAAKAKEYADNITAAYDYYMAVKDAYDGTLESYEIVNDAYSQLQNAIESGNNFITAQNVLTDDLLEEQYTKILEDQKKALEENADAFEELCDIRKELLETYKEEQDYLKELEKKQRNIAKLSTKLTIARLDTSAAGQARVRELEEELREAQEELDDFTLEHAIDVVTKQIEESNNQFRQIIDSGVDRLTAAIAAVGSMTSHAIAEAITKAGETPVVSGDTTTGSISGAIGDVQAGIAGGAGNKLPDKVPIDAPTKYEPEPEEPVVKPAKKVLINGTDYSVSGLSGGASWGKDDITVTIGDHTYDVKVSTSEVDESTNRALNNLYDGERPKNGTIAVYGGVAYITKKGTWRQLVEEDVSSLTSRYLKELNEYHTGGFVGGLESNEEFAKLLNGEFVATPLQMQHFMERTLPAIANYTSSGGNEFNAPLIEIKCDNVTSEAVPMLESIVKEAVKEIQKQLDGGVSRTGYKRSVKKLLV